MKNLSEKPSFIENHWGSILTHGAIRGARNGVIAGLGMAAMGSTAALTTATAGSFLALAATCAIGGAIMVLPLMKLGVNIYSKDSSTLATGFFMIALNNMFIVGTVAIGAGLLGVAIVPALASAVTINNAFIALMILASMITFKIDKSDKDNNDPEKSISRDDTPSKMIMKMAF